MTWKIINVEDVIVIYLGPNPTKFLTYYILFWSPDAIIQARFGGHLISPDGHICVPNVNLQKILHETYFQPHISPKSPNR